MEECDQNERSGDYVFLHVRIQVRVQCTSVKRSIDLSLTKFSTVSLNIMGLVLSIMKFVMTRNPFRSRNVLSVSAEPKSIPPLQQGYPGLISSFFFSTVSKQKTLVDGGAYAFNYEH